MAAQRACPAAYGLDAEEVLGSPWPRTRDGIVRSCVILGGLPGRPDRGDVRFVLRVEQHRGSKVLPETRRKVRSVAEQGNAVGRRCPQSPLGDL